MAVSMVTIIFGLLRTVLLMRWLADPDPFGIITLALFFSTIAVPLATFGVDSALIQAKDPPPSAFSTSFVLRLGFSTGIIALVFIISPVLRGFYSDSVIHLIWIMLVINLVEATYSPHTIILRRELRFGTLALLNLIASLAMTITAPLLALFGFGIWSLVAERAAGPLVRWLYFWGLSRIWKPSVKYDTEQAKKLLGFGSQVVLTNILGVLLDRFDDFWTGTSLGKSALGYYSRAYDLAQYPERILVTPVTNVFFSTYAIVQDRAQDLTQAFWQASSFLVRLGLLLAVFLVTAAGELTVVLFGKTWLPIVPVFQLMLIYIVLDPIYNNLSYLMIGIGHPRLLNKVRGIQVLVFVIAVISFSYLWNIFGVAMAANLMMLVGTLLLFYYSRRFVEVSFLRLFGWPACAAIFSGLSVWLISGQLSHINNPWYILIAKSLVVGFAYIGILFLAEREAILEIFRYTLQIFKVTKDRPNA